jgi:hypothetical protein
LPFRWWLSLAWLPPLECRPQNSASRSRANIHLVRRFPARL